MSIRKVRGIVTEAKAKGENDKWLTVLCKDMGKISVKARGCRKPNSKLFACTSLFAYCDFVIDDHMRFYNLVSGDIIRSFFVGCDDIRVLSLANYFLEITNRLLKHGMADNDFMYLLLKALQALDRQKNDIRTIGYIFEIRTLITSGYMPYMDSCISCNSPDTEFFHPEGMLCAACAKGVKTVHLTPEAYTALLLSVSADVDKVFGLKFDNSVLKQLSACARLMMKHYLDVDFNTYNLIKYMDWY